MPRFTRRAVLAGAFGAALLGGAGVAQVYRFQVNRHRVVLPGLTAPVRVVQLSDLHHGPYIGLGPVRAWVDAALAARPDLILVTGDLLDETMQGDPGPLVAELGRLRAPLGVLAVWGNHDYGSWGRYGNLRVRFMLDWPVRQIALANALADVGIRVLVNENVRVRPDLLVGGVDDERVGLPDLELALRGMGEGATLLMSHNPDLLPRVPPGVGLTLCGHTHGGQVRLPGVGALVTSSEYGERFAQGFVRGPAPGFVSRGLGVSTLPVRWACPPEVVVLDLVPRA